jgi:hypothetical protein
MTKDSQAFDNSQTYQTNTVALISLMLFTAAVVGVVLASGGGSILKNNDTNQPKASQKQPQEDAVAVDNTEELSRQDVQPNDQGPVESRSVDTTDDLPLGLVIDGATVISNKEVTYAGDSQRNIALETSQTSSETFSYYQSWFQDNGFKILNSSEEDGFMLGRDDSTDITLSFERQSDATLVNMEYIPLSE